MQLNLPSLTSELAPTAPARAPARRFELRVPERLRRWWAWRLEEPRRKRTLVWLRVGTAAAILGLGVGLFFALRPVPEPDYDTDGLDDVLGYTLLTDEFNALPVEERMKLIGQLVQRFRSMDASDSVLMASFAAGIAGSARDQLERNASRLAIDMWDKYAKDYAKVPSEQRAEFLDKTAIEFVKTMEAISGEARDIPDSERLKDIREQVAEEDRMLRNPDRRPPPQAIGRLFSIMTNNVAGHATPQQRARGQQMIRDMVRHFRNQDIATGKPLGPP